MTGYQVMPRLTPDEYADLEQSIETDGVLVPIIVSPGGEIIDGHHRAEIARKHGIHCPEVVKHGEPAELRTFAYSLNLNRRHLTREQRRDLIAQSLRQDPQLADREHARRTGASHPTVAAVRSELVKTGDVEELSTRTDSLGRQQPASRPPMRQQPADLAAEAAEHFAASDAEYGRQAAEMERALREGQAAADQPSPAVTDWLESSQAVKDSGYLREYTKAIHRAGEFLRFDATRLSSLLEPVDVEILERYVASVSRFADTIRRGRTGLRVINGGN